MEQTKILQELKEIRRFLFLQKQILTLDEFCLYAGISKHQAYHLTSTGKVKFYRPFGKMIYFNRDEVVEFLQNNPVVNNKQVIQKSNSQLLTSKI